MMRSPLNIFLYTVMVIAGFVIQKPVMAQCTTTLNSFPYDEGFEGAGNGNWTSIPSGEWQCGTPGSNKHVIVSPGNGAKSWIVGGLNSSSYSSGNSELRSPCFDFSALTNPQISFLVFWETERKYDGTIFQYSLDAGNSWTTLGTENSNTTCVGTNWYNTYPLINVGANQAGWSGNIQTGGGGGGNCLYGLGSGGWVSSQHNMSMLAGMPSVMFRFYFGAGTQCNDFDGFAIDDVHIGDAAPPGVADFYYSCLGTSAISFVNNSAACNVSWNFDDAASGINNTSTALNPTHTFIGTGQVHNVTLTAYFAAGNTDTKTIQINMPYAEPHVLNLNKCNGDLDNSFELINLGQASNEYMFSWNTNPVQTTQVVSGLPGRDDYFVTVTTATGCPFTVGFGFPDPPPLAIVATPVSAKCLANNGSIITAVTGGEAPYLYTWNTTPPQHTSSINNLADGFYSLQLTDNLGCVKQVNGIEVTRTSATINVSLGDIDFVCPGATLVLNPGAYETYKWQDNSTSPTFTVTHEGIYSVQVTDRDGCIGSGSIEISGDCRDVFFPTAFTPGTDPLNPTFGAIGNIHSLSSYSLTIYNRYSEVVFTSNDPYKKWDGTYKGQPQETQSYVWLARYSQRGKQPVVKKGSVLLAR